jgi:hypothetical protein
MRRSLYQFRAFSPAAWLIYQFGTRKSCSLACRAAPVFDFDYASKSELPLDGLLPKLDSLPRRAFCDLVILRDAASAPQSTERALFDWQVRTW